MFYSSSRISSTLKNYYSFIASYAKELPSESPPGSAPSGLDKLQRNPVTSKWPGFHCLHIERTQPEIQSLLKDSNQKGKISPQTTPPDDAQKTDMELTNEIKLEKDVADGNIYEQGDIIVGANLRLGTAKFSLL